MSVLKFEFNLSKTSMIVASDDSSGVKEAYNWVTSSDFGSYLTPTRKYGTTRDLSTDTPGIGGFIPFDFVEQLNRMIREFVLT